MISVFMFSSLFLYGTYISDELHTYVHSGPSTKFKIIGIVNAGEHIAVIKREGDFVQIKDSKGRTGWINSKYVSSKMGLKERVPKLEKQVAELKEQLDTANGKISKDRSSLSKHQKTNQAQLKQIKELKQENEILTQRLDAQRNKQLMTWFTYGGMVAGGGLIFGLIMPYLIPNRNKKRRW